MKKKTRVLVISYTAALVAALAVGLIACRTDADRRQTAMDANYRHAYGEVLNAVQELDAALQKSLYATTPAMACTVCTDIYSHAQTAQMALGVLPVQSHALARIARNIALAGDYARMLSRSAADGRAFAAEELAQLRALSETTTQLSVRLGALGASLADGAVTTAAHVRSTQSLANLDTEAELPDTLEAELAALADSFEDLPLPIADGTYCERTAAEYAVLAGRDDVTEGQAQTAAAVFLDMDASRLRATGRSEGAVPCWNFDIDDGDDASYISLTVKGGEVLRYYSSCNGGSRCSHRNRRRRQRQIFCARAAIRICACSKRRMRDGRSSARFAMCRTACCARRTGCACASGSTAARSAAFRQRSILIRTGHARCRRT